MADRRLPTWANPGKPDLKAPDTYTAADIEDFPVFFLQRQDVWRKADAEAKAVMRNRSIELFAQSMNDKDERNMRELVRRYPDMSPGVLQGLASGQPQVMPNGDTAEPFSDQGLPMIAAYDSAYEADVRSQVDAKEYGKTGINPVPQAIGLGAISIGGANVPEGAEDFAPQEDTTSPLVDAGRAVKGAFNVFLNALGDISNTQNAATETSAGNEQLMREQMKRFGLTPEDAKQVYGDDYIELEQYQPATPGETAQTDPRAGAGLAVLNWLTTNPQDQESADPTVPEADLSVPLDERIRQAKAEWRQHLVDTNQITESGDRSFRNITGRSTLALQKETDTIGQGGWFGGGVEEVDKKQRGLAGRQSDIRPYAARQASKTVANAIRQQWRDAGVEMSLDDYTLMTSPRTWTEGRAFTSALGMTPGTAAEMAMSGFIDIAVTLGTDPTSYTPPGLVKNVGMRGLNAASKARPAVRAGERAAWFEVEQMARKASKGDDLLELDDTVGATGRPHAKRTDSYLWDTDNGDWVLKDETGQVVQGGPRLTRTSQKERYYGGFDIEKEVPAGRTRPVWKVTDKDGNTSTYRTRREARQAVEAAGGRGSGPRNRPTVYETWDSPAGSFGSLSEAMTKTREQHLFDQGIAQSKVTTSRAAWDWMLNSQSGVEFTRAVAGMTSPYAIWLRSNRKIPWDTAVRLANAGTPEEVRAVASGMIGPQVVDPLALKNFSGIRARAYNGRISLVERPVAKRMYKALSFAPKVVPIDMNNTEEVIDAAHRFGVAVGMTPREIEPFINNIGTARSNLETFNTFHDDLVLTGAKNALERAGVPDERINELLAKVKNSRKGAELPKTKEKTAKFRTRQLAILNADELVAEQKRVSGGQLLDSTVADGNFVKRVNDEVAMFAHELSASHLVLPTPRELRREMNKIAQITRRTDLGEEITDRAFQVMSRSLDTWRNLTLMNVSYIFRNIAEEIMTMSLLGARGLLNNPFHAIAGTMAMHAQMEYASGFRGMQKAVDRAIPFSRAIRQMRYYPEKYEGVRLVDKASLRNLVTSAQGQIALTTVSRGEARTAKGRKVGMEGFISDVERGIVNPIEVTVDNHTGRYAVTDGVKRLLAAFDSDQVGDIPVRVIPGTLEPSQGRRLPTGGNVDEWQHADLWGSGVRGTLEDAQDAARAAVERQMGIMRALRYVVPYFDHNMAMANGRSYTAAFDNAVKTGDVHDVSSFLQLATRLHGSALLDEHPDKVGNPKRVRNSSGQNIDVVYPVESNGTLKATDGEEFKAYVDNYADILGQLASDRATRKYLAGEMTIDELTMEIVSDPRKLRDVLGTLQQGVYDSSAKLVQTRGPRAIGDIDDEEVIRYQQENAYDTVRGVLQENLHSVGVYLGRGTSPTMRRAVMEGRFAGKPINSRNRPLRKAIAEELATNPSFAKAVPGLRVASLENPGVFTRLTNSFFASAGNIRDMITLHPFMRDVYTEEVVRLAKFMSPQGRDAMIADMRRAGDEKFADRVADQPYVQGEGWLDPDTVHTLADAHTRSTAEKSFYNAANRRNWAVMLRWASPFAQAAVNSTYRWGAAMARDPIAAHRTARSLNAIKDAMGEWVGVYEPELEDQMGVKGHLDRNEYGEEMFIYPLVGKLASLVGADPVAASFTGQSVNVFQTGVVTGFGPVALFALGATPFRDVQSRNDVVGDIMRFFQPFPIDQSGIGEGWTRAGSSFIPSKWADIINVNDEEVTRMTQAMLTARLASGEYGPLEEMPPEQATQIAEDLNNDARRLLRLEGITKLFGPLLGSFNFSPMINTDKVAQNMPEGVKGKAVLDYMITAEYQAYVGDATGDERMKRTTLFMRDYGKYLPVVAQGRTTSGVENQPVYTGSGNVTNFAYDSPDLYREYRNSIGYMFPGGDYQTQWTDYDRFLRQRDKASGVLKVRDVANQVEYTRQYMMRWAKQARLQQAVDDEPDDYENVVRRINDEFGDSGLKGFDEDYRNFMMGQLKRAAADDRVRSKVRSATYVNDYFEARDKVIEYIRSNSDLAGDFSGDTVWTQDDAVRRLYLAGVRAAAEDEGFANFWVSLGEQEYGDMPDKYLGTGG